MNRSPLTDRHKELLGMPTIASQLPVIFNNGMKWTVINCSCSGCNADIPHEKVRGSFSMAFPRVAVLNAVGVCDACKLLTEYSWRLHEDRRITVLTNQGWKTRKAHPTAWERLNKRLRRLLKALLP